MRSNYPASRRCRLAAHLTSLCVFIALASGCASSRSTRFVRDYNAGRHAMAYRGATDAATTSIGADREEAALIAGLSAHALADTINASTWLTPLLQSPDRSIASRAAAALGLIAQDRGDHERAASLLNQASLSLSGDDAAQAGLHAGEAFTELGQRDAAHRAYQRAFGQAQDPKLKQTLTDRLNNRRFTIQLGAFADRRNADRVAHEHAAVTSGLGLGVPRIVQTTENGRTLYLVQAGSFRTQSDAERIRTRLGVRAIVAAAPD